MNNQMGYWFNAHLFGFDFCLLTYLDFWPYSFLILIFRNHTLSP